MKPAPIFFSALILLLGMGAPKSAAPQQQAPAGTKLPAAQGPGGSTKMLFEALPNLHVVETEVVEFDFYRFGYLKGTPRIEGRRTITSYGLDPGSPMPGALGICRHFVTATHQAGGEVLYDNHRNIVTLKFNQQGLETWAEVACDKDRYRVVIVERQGPGRSTSDTTPDQSNPTKTKELNAKVRDAVRANADKAFDELNAEEAKHKKVAAPQAGSQPATDASNVMESKDDTAKNSISIVPPPGTPTGGQQGSSGTSPGTTDLRKQSQGTAKPKVPSKSPAGSGRGDDVPKESVSFNKAPSAPKSQTSARLSIVRGDGKVLPCTDEPTLMRRGYTKGCTATEADKPLCDLLTSNQLQLVDTNMWSCHTKDGSQVEGALATDQPPQGVSAASKGNPSGQFSIVVDNGGTGGLAAPIPCTDPPTQMTQLSARHTWSRTPLKRGIIKDISFSKLHLVDTYMWSCHSKDGSLVEGALITDQPLSIQNPPIQ